MNDLAYLDSRVGSDYAWRMERALSYSTPTTKQPKAKTTESTGGTSAAMRMTGDKKDLTKIRFGTTP